MAGQIPGSIYDADGHVLEDLDDMRGFIDKSWGAGTGGAGLIPSLDQFHTPSDGTPRLPGTFIPAPAERWLEILDRRDPGA